MLRIALLLLVTSLLSGCLYHFGQGCLQERYHTVTIPYVGGDEDGRFTAILVQQISETGKWQYCFEGGDVVLSVKLLKIRNKNIGFRYDRRRKKDELLNTIVPTETRRTAYCEVTVIDACTGRTVIGPVCISANVTFDHDYYSSRDAVNIFSLGQLGDIDAAYDASLVPLYQKLAEKITDYVINSW